MNTKNYLILLCLVFFAPQVYAQSFIVKGMLQGKNGEGLMDSRIKNKRTKVKTICEDYEGKYTIEASKGDTLEFSCEFYLTQNIVVRKSEYNVVLQIDTTYTREPFVRPYRKTEATEQVNKIEPTEPVESKPIAKEITESQSPQITYIVDGNTMGKDLPSDFGLSSIESITIMKDAMYESQSEAINAPIIVDITTHPGYDVVVMEPGYDTFMMTQPAKESYSLSTLKRKNVRMIKEWNARCKNPAQYNSDIYQMEIDYNPLIEYGLDVEYKMHMFFRFVSEKYGLRLD